jgi:hypothetical protein
MTSIITGLTSHKKKNKRALTEGTAGTVFADGSYLIRGGTSERIRQLIKIERKIAALEAMRASLVTTGSVPRASGKTPPPKGAVPIIDYLRKRFPKADGYAIRFRAQTVRIHLQREERPTGWLRLPRRNPVNAARPEDIDAVLTPELCAVFEKGGE